MNYITEEKIKLQYPAAGEVLGQNCSRKTLLPMYLFVVLFM
jgi:hypothetical protein